MATHYTPRWKDDDGNVVIFPAGNTLFDNEHDARTWQFGEFIFFVPFGLKPDGVLEFDAVDGKAQIPHCDGSFGPLGDCCIIDGPLGPEKLKVSTD
jgi:hypothetical protein